MILEKSLLFKQLINPMVALLDGHRYCGSGILCRSGADCLMTRHKSCALQQYRHTTGGTCRSVAHQCDAVQSAAEANN